DDSGKLDLIGAGLDVSWMSAQNIPFERMNSFFPFAGLYLGGFKHLGFEACIAENFLESFGDVPGLRVNAVDHGFSSVPFRFGANPQEFFLFGIKRLLRQRSRFRQDSAALLVFDGFL